MNMRYTSNLLLRRAVAARHESIHAYFDICLCCTLFPCFVSASSPLISRDYFCNQSMIAFLVICSDQVYKPRYEDPSKCS
jgi:hypothetical protein